MPDVPPFTISRVLNAPRELVFKAHTEPRHLAQWMSPQGFESIKSVQDFRVGGTHHYGLKGPGGMEMWGKQVYLEIVPNEKIVHIQSFSDKDGGLTRHPMATTWPLEMLATTTFEDLGGGKSKVTITWKPHNSDDTGRATFDGARQGMAGGFEGTFRKLEDYLANLQGARTSLVEYPSDTEILFTRIVEAPRSLVWKAYVTPGMVEKWWGPEGFRTTTHEFSMKPGGVWRMTMHGPDGKDWPNKITYLEIKPEELLHYDHGDFEKVHFRVTTRFVAEGASRTKIVSRMVMATKAQRDALATHGIPGHNSTMGRLEALLAKG